GPGGLQDASHDVDGGVVAIEQRRGGDEADVVVGAVDFGGLVGGSAHRGLRRGSSVCAGNIATGGRCVSLELELTWLFGPSAVSLQRSAISLQQSAFVPQPAPLPLPLPLPFPLESMPLPSSREPHLHLHLAGVRLASIHRQ